MIKSDDTSAVRSATQPWGKFDREANTSHHLAHHCADVAACFLQLIGLPAFRDRLHHAAKRPLSVVEIERLAVLVFLHDAGKLHPGFQARGWPDKAQRTPPRGHVREGLQIFLAQDAGENLKIADHLHIGALGAWGITPSMLRAIISHHGRPANLTTTSLREAQHDWRARGSYDPDAAARELGSLIAAWFPLAFRDGGPTLPEGVPAFEHLICGLTTLADWVGSDAERFPHVSEIQLDYMQNAKAAAAAACRAVGLDAARQRAARMQAISFAELTGFTQANAQQTLVGSLDLAAKIVILEAETGSGKTEAALWHYMRLFKAGRVDGLYFAVPTRAAAVQLHSRIVQSARRVFADASPSPVLAVPGYIKAGEIEGTALPHWRVLWDDAADVDGDTLAGRWAAEHAKRYLAAQIAVGTVDQAMLAALAVKHAHLRAGSLSRSLLVIDEVHASDAYMTAVQKRLLESHVAVGGYAFLMSATLGSHVRARWLNHTAPDLNTAIELPYPAVWTSADQMPRIPSADTKSKQRPKQVAMEAVATMAADATAERALASARQGARVLVIRNTVDRAIETLKAVEAALRPGEETYLFRIGATSTLHHSRFAPADRKHLDAAVETALTTNKERVPEGRIVIGTQTLEQSLDVDADTLITDLCPVDVLLQRIGRLHRHRLHRPPGFEDSRCSVLVPEAGLVPLLAPAFENGLGAWRDASGVLQGVYRDVSILELTRRLVEHHRVWTIPDMNRFLVESALHPEAIEALHRELGPAWVKYRNDVIGSELGDRLAAHGVLIDRTKRFEDLAFPNADELKIRTRLGADSVRFDLAKPHSIGPFGEPVTEIVLPGRWCLDLIVDNHRAEHSRNNDAVLIIISGASFLYDRFGLVRTS